jgi:ADP-ribosylation factor-like protein 2
LQGLDLDGIKSHQWSIVSCSAVTGYNIIEGINWVVEDVAERLYYGAAFGSAPSILAPPPLAQHLTI